MEVLTRSRADAELSQAGEREGARVAEKASNSHRLPLGAQAESSGSGWGLSLLWELLSSQAARRCSRAPCLEKWVLGTGTGNEDPPGTWVGGGGGSLCSWVPAPVPCSLLTPTKCGKDTSYPSHSGLLGLWLEHSLGFMAWGRGRGGCLIRIHSTQAPLCPAPDPCSSVPDSCFIGLTDRVCQHTMAYLNCAQNHSCALLRSFSRQCFHILVLGREEAEGRPPLTTVSWVVGGWVSWANSRGLVPGHSTLLSGRDG